MNSKQFWDHSTKPSMFVQVENGVEVYRGPFKEVKPRDFNKEIEMLRRERDEVIADRDIARLAAMGSDRAHDRMVGELEKVYRERDEAREAAAKWEPSFDAMERAGAEQARRADENREWALRAERERDESREALARITEAAQAVVAALKA